MSDPQQQLNRAYDIALGLIEVARTETPETLFSRVMLQRSRALRDELEAALSTGAVPSVSPAPQEPCANGFSTYTATCGAKFSTQEERDDHNETCSKPSAVSTPDLSQLIAEWKQDLHDCIVCVGLEVPCEHCMMTARHLGQLEALLAQTRA